MKKYDRAFSFIPGKTDAHAD